MRAARKRCESDIYHVIVRGVGGQLLFEDDDDRMFFLTALAEYRTSNGVELYAWCLMSNHVHLILHGPLDSISSMMHSLETRYAGHFNFRHARTGTLFQGRFTSVAIESDAQLLEAVRYVHRNPLGAGRAIDGLWSSYRDYLGRGGPIDVDTAFVLDIFGGEAPFRKYHDEAGVPGASGATGNRQESYRSRLPRHRIKDEDAMRIAKEILGTVSPYDLRSLEKAQRDAILVELRDAGLSARQIGRITSIGENIIYRAKRPK